MVHQLLIVFFSDNNEILHNVHCTENFSSCDHDCVSFDIRQHTHLFDSIRTLLHLENLLYVINLEQPTG